ncbi:hypothetical protein MKW92_030697 [Papaver armeniacum]|nr:hypothetical protein MKW92_030697 [Papaver armeniacum]
MEVLRQDSDEMKQAMVETEKKLKLEKETIVAAMAEDKSLRLSDLQESRMKERPEELSHQLDEFDILSIY